MAHYHIIKQSRGTTPDKKSRIIKHLHSTKGLIPNHSHEGMVDGNWKNMKEAEQARDIYDSKVDEYRKRLQKMARQKAKDSNG